MQSFASSRRWRFTAAHRLCRLRLLVPLTSRRRNGKSWSAATRSANAPAPPSAGNDHACRSRLQRGWEEQRSAIGGEDLRHATPPSLALQSSARASNSAISIEMAFSKLKSLLRQEPARTIDGLVERIGHLLDRFLPSECANFFHAADYQRSI